jgi:CRP/FNR family transcriptional regulator, cyclic AMP receptor protein
MTEINVFRNAADAESLEAGATLFREGDPGDVMYAVAEGSIELIVDGTVVENVGPGGILGELALIDAAPRSATAIAATATRIVRVDHPRFNYLVHEHPTFALQVMTVMAERLRRANHQHS